MNSLLITGYKAFELGILTAKDPRLPIIKEAIRRDLVRFLEEGVKWLIFTGNLGFEAWALEVAQELRKDYEIQLATIFMFENQGENWNEANQEVLSRFKQVDFVKYAYPSYSQPGQFKESPGQTVALWLVISIRALESCSGSSVMIKRVFFL